MKQEMRTLADLSSFADRGLLLASVRLVVLLDFDAYFGIVVAVLGGSTIAIALELRADYGISTRLSSQATVRHSSTAYAA